MKFLNHNLENIAIAVSFSKNDKGIWEAKGNVRAAVDGGASKQICIFRRNSGYSHAAVFCNSFAEGVKKGARVIGGSVDLIKAIDIEIHRQASIQNSRRKDATANAKKAKPAVKTVKPIMPDALPCISMTCIQPQLANPMFMIG